MDTNGQVTDAPAAEKPAGTQSILYRPSFRPRTVRAPHALSKPDPLTDFVQF